jgi:hypothetical protein
MHTMAALVAASQQLRRLAPDDCTPDLLGYGNTKDLVQKKLAVANARD